MRFPRLASPRLAAVCGFAPLLLSLASTPSRAERTDTARPPLTAAEARARALLLETDRETLAPPDWGVLQKPQPLVSPSAAVTDSVPATPAVVTQPTRPQRGRIDPVVVAMIALGAGSLATLLALAIGSLRRDRNDGPSSILPR